MPLYEHRCSRCGKRHTILTLRIGEAVDPTCPRCGTATLERVPSRFAMPRSDDARLGALADPAALGGVDESDPRSVARWMRRMGGELGDEMGGGELDEMVDRVESGDTGDDDGE